MIGRYRSVDGGMAVIETYDPSADPLYPYLGHWISSDGTTSMHAGWNDKGQSSVSSEMDISQEVLDLLRVLHTEREHYRQLQMNSSGWLCENRQLRKDLQWALGAIERMRDYAKKSWDYWRLDQDHKAGKRLRAMAGELEGYDECLDGIFRRVEKLRQSWEEH